MYRSFRVDPSRPLDVKRLDLRVEENAREHHTDKYEVTEEKPYSYRGRLNQDVALVIRRGQHFDISATFNRDYSKTKDKIKLKFNPDDISSKYSIEVAVDGKSNNGWSAKITKDRGETVYIRVMPPADAYIAKYKVTMVTSREGKDDYYTLRTRMFVLCNPWCKDDLVYLDAEEERTEYVLRDSGILYRGSSSKIYEKKWTFGQFEDFILDVVMDLLDKSTVIKDEQRGDPILLARSISQITNSTDEKGVLVGKWGGGYDGGTRPLKWSSSVDILKQYYQKKQPVKYGQCWVFSALVTTMCRCLGIPARSITNFTSAHDCDYSVTIDSFYYEGDDPTDRDNVWKDDSVWNFHVWNDVWMARPDLEPGYGGWQAIDGTPQEPSLNEPGKGLYITGPVPVLALKRGNVAMPYDGRMVFAAMNGDRIQWEVSHDGKTKTPVSIRESSVGKILSTKAVGRTSRNDITDMYKYKEGSEEERATVIRAVQQGSKRKDVPEIYDQTKDVEISLVETSDSNNTPLGKPFDAEIKFKNTSNEKRTVDVTLKASLVWYTGDPAEVIKKMTKDVVCNTGQTSTLKMTVATDDYINKLVDMCYIKICCMARVRETNQVHFDDYLFMLDKPELNIKAPAEVSLGREYDVTVSFTNPFPYPLTDCAFTLEGPGHLKISEIKHRNISAKGEGKVTFKVRSGHVMEGDLVAGFDSEELSDLSGSVDIKVVKGDAEPENPPTPNPAFTRPTYLLSQPRAPSVNSTPNTPEVPAQVKPTSPLDIKRLDLRVEENAREHHTDKYELTEEKPYSYRGRLNQDVALVIRRGQHFDISATFNRDYSKAHDKIKLQLNPDDISSSYTIKVEVEGKDNSGWKATIIKDKGESVDIRVSPPADAYIAKYKVTMETSLDGKNDYYTPKNRMFVLCNPWCKDDLVYLDSEDERKEYVLKDSGILYRGSSRKIYEKKWTFGQFEDFILDVVMDLLEKSTVIKDEQRGDAILLARSISQITNSTDEKGVLVGKWGGGYDGGTRPLKWSSSVDILKEYYQKKQPVKYGQCWVFSALVTTMCRCLGIPARSITNFTSAHDCDYSVTIDSFYYEGDDPTDRDNVWKDDSVWNFHVWNDVWMARPDLEPGYGGWQAIDGTPQEPSLHEPGRGLYITGPVPVLALKRGNVAMPYDGRMVFAAMNGDRIQWEVSRDGKTKTPVSIRESSVGKILSTKAVGRTSRNDITDMYKYKEGSEEERATVIRAVQQGSKRKEVPEIYDQTKDVLISLVETSDSNNTPLGKPFDAEIKFKNTSNEKRTVDVTMKASLVWYTGDPAEVIKKMTKDVVCNSGQTSTLRMTVDADDYINKLVDMCYIKICCMARVRETNQVHFDDYLFMLDKPELKVKAPSKVSLGKEYEVTVSFTNPFPYPLTDCAFTLEGPGHLKITEMGHKNIAAQGEGKVTFKVTSVHVIEGELVAGFDSEELSDLSGSADISVV